jgi:hypothetical protein
MRQNLALQQKIDILESAATPASVSGQHTRSGATMRRKWPRNPPVIRQHLLSLPLSTNATLATVNIGMGGLDVAFAIPSKPSTSGYRVHIGTYRNETDAHRAHHLLEQLDHYLLDHVFFNVEPQQRRNAIYYDLVSAPLPKHHVTALCAVLWQQKMGCSASFAP